MGAHVYKSQGNSSLKPTQCFPGAKHSPAQELEVSALDEIDAVRASKLEAQNHREKAPSMSIYACSTGEQGQSCSGDDAAPCSETVTQQDAHQTPSDSNSMQSSASELLASLWSPLGSLLSTSSSTNERIDRRGIDKGTLASIEGSEGEAQKTEDPKLEAEESNRETDGTHSTPEKLRSLSPPEAYYAPNDVPAFKALQRKRLTGTRTKQLLRAASRAYDDPPPGPELGLCCGSSCDPCVNDLWREERSVWRERWGDRGVESNVAGNRKKDLEW